MPFQKTGLGQSPILNLDKLKKRYQELSLKEALGLSLEEQKELDQIKLILVKD